MKCGLTLRYTALFAALFMSAQAQALTYTMGANTKEQGASSIGLQTTFGEGKRQGSYSSQYFKLGYAYGLSDSLELDLGLNAYRHDYSGDPVPGEIEGKRNSFQFSGGQIGLKKNLQPALNDQLGVALYGMVKYDSIDNLSGEKTAAWELEGKLITQQGFWDNKVQWINNIQLEAETAEANREREIAFTTRIRSGVTYALNANWKIGLEGFWDAEVLKPHQQQWEFDHWDLFAGPALSYSDKHWQMGLTLMPQIVGSDERDSAKTGLHLADHEKLNARLTVVRKF